MKVCFLTQHALRPASLTGLSRQTCHELAFTTKDENLFPLVPTPLFLCETGCGHAPVGGDGGDEEDGGDEGDAGDSEDRGDRGDRGVITSLPSPSSSPSLPSLPSPSSSPSPPSPPSPSSLKAKRPTTYDHTR